MAVSLTGFFHTSSEYRNDSHQFWHSRTVNDSQLTTLNQLKASCVVQDENAVICSKQGIGENYAAEIFTSKSLSCQN